ncbi:MAG TPA: hypothetical protein VJB87_04865 [Candidatus Nanoarchaeia archaeon]|nr:hypothetical protein [Candidatus Nanoarchaeia archaeon]
MKYLKLWSAAVLIVIMFLAADILLAPTAGEELRTRHVQFEKVGLSNYILVDDNPSFTTPLLIHKPWEIWLEPGTYYWQSSGLSETRNFTIASIVGITVNTTHNQTTIKNTGNVAAQINTLTGAFVLDWGKKTTIETTGEVLAQQHD